MDIAKMTLGQYRDITPEQLAVVDRAKEILLDQMRVAECDQLGIDAVSFACGCRPLEIAVDRAEFYFNAVNVQAPTVAELIAQAQ